MLFAGASGPKAPPTERGDAVGVSGGRLRLELRDERPERRLRLVGEPEIRERFADVARLERGMEVRARGAPRRRQGLVRKGEVRRAPRLRARDDRVGLRELV